MPAPIFDGVLGRLEVAIDLRTRQHGLLASNVANAETPDYHARRLDFRASYDRAVQALQDGKVAMRATRPEHLGAAPSPADLAEIEVIEPSPIAMDGNSVNAEEEMITLAENQLLYNSTVEVLNRRLAMLEYAASDGGR